MPPALNRLLRRLSAGILAALLVLPGMARAEDAGAPSSSSEPAAAAQATGAEATGLLPPPAVTRHSIHLAGVEIAYSAKAATLSLRDARGKTLADIFYVAYMREPLDPKRPVTFVFNGGPGAASAYLHLGAIGPKAVAASAKGEVLGPPPRLVANES
ncbi:MAG: peptidase S10, partial [Methyloceanibacter sp.]